jgi:hypothetical protein
MNKAFLREPDGHAEYCPRCGAEGESVGDETLRAQLPGELAGRVASPANFCPSPRCEVVYFDGFERTITTAEFPRPVYPKDPTAPICACFGLTLDDVEADVREGGVARVRAAVEKAKSPEACCAVRAVNGRSCVAYIQKCYMQRRNETERR